VKLLEDAEDALVVGELMAEIRLRITLGGDDLFHAKEVGELDGLDDFRGAVTVR
jgi:hypothetical protein